MGIETALIIGATAAGAGGQLYSGITTNQAAKKEASLQRIQAEQARSEAEFEAARVAKENNKVLQKQKLAFIKNGVSLEGSPMLVLEDTMAESAAEVNAVLKRGEAQLNLGYAQADMTKSAGKSALIGSLFQAGGTAMSGGQKAFKAAG